jgi:multidrug efflux pump subunit AcrB
LAISHLNGRRQINVEADISSTEVSVPEITDRIRNQILPPILNRYPGVSSSFEGQFREFSRTMNSIYKIIPAVLILMIAMMVFTCKSFTQAIVLFILVPFSLIGAAWGHAIHGLPISIFSGLGFIALAGILVNDGLVFINTFNDKLRNGGKYMETLHQTGTERFRPIFLTTITTVGGLGPLIFNTSLQAQFLIPMAVTVAYGLFIGSILTLTLLPTFLFAENRIKIWVQWLWTGKKPSKEEVEHAVTDKKFDLSNEDLI